MSRWQRGWHHVASALSGAVCVLCVWAMIVTVPDDWSVWIPLTFAVLNAAMAVYHWREARS